MKGVLVSATLTLDTLFRAAFTAEDPSVELLLPEEVDDPAAIDFALGQLTGMLGSDAKNGFVKGAMTGWASDPLTLGGYALYTWQNPWFAVLKGTTLLGLCLPFGVYASETLCRWGRRHRAVAVGLGAVGVALVVCVTLSCTFQGWFERTEVSGMHWKEAEVR